MLYITYVDNINPLEFTNILGKNVVSTKSTFVKTIFHAQTDPMFIKHTFFLGYLTTDCKIFTMQGLAIFLGLLSASSALYISPVNRPLYDLLIASKKLTSGADQRLDCYDQTNCYGTRITIGTSPVPDLNSSPYYFDNRIQSCNYNGIYLLYDGRNYNQDNLNVSMIT